MENQSSLKKQTSLSSNFSLQLLKSIRHAELQFLLLQREIFINTHEKVKMLESTSLKISNKGNIQQILLNTVNNDKTAK